MKKEKKITVGEITRAVLREFSDTIFDLISFDNKDKIFIEDEILIEEIPGLVGAKEEPSFAEEKPKRARTGKGRYKADDKSTKDVNETWVGGKTPKKRRKK